MSKTITPRAKYERKEPFWQELNKIEDPEMMIGLVDLGLIYELKIENGKAEVIMTLTSLGCPVGPELMEKVKVAMLQQDGVKDCHVELVWDPPWSMDMMDEDIKALLWGM